MYIGRTLPRFEHFHSKEYNKYIMSFPQYKFQALNFTDLLFPKPLIFQTCPRPAEIQQVNRL